MTSDDGMEWFPEQRARIYRHIGESVSLAAELDGELTALIALLVSPSNPDPEQVKWRGRPLGDKLKKLAKLFPTEWVSGRQLRQSLQIAADARNGLAHSEIDFDFRMRQPGAGWMSKIERRDGTMEAHPLVIADLDGQLQLLVVLKWTVSYLIYPGQALVAGGFRIEGFDLRSVLLDEAQQEGQSYLNPAAGSSWWTPTVERIFPRPDSGGVER